MTNNSSSAFKTLSILAFTIAVGANLLYAQTKEIEVNRTQLWARLNMKVKATKNLGFIAMAGSRYNTSFSKSVNGVETDTKTQGAWLQELWAGPFYANKLNDEVFFSANLLYRPQFWYIDEAKESSFIRHTISNSYTVNWEIGRFTPHYRLMLWHMFGADQPGTAGYDYELVVRNLLGLRFELTPWLDIIAEEELYLKPTADDDDLDGTEMLHKNALWLGIDLHPSKTLTVSLRYVPFYTNKVDNAAIRTTVNDDYLLLEITKLFTLGSKGS